MLVGRRAPSQGGPGRDLGLRWTLHSGGWCPGSLLPTSAEGLCCGEAEQ